MNHPGPEREPVNVFIYGSCVSRDTFEHVDKSFVLSQYVARQSWISAGTDASGVAAKLKPIDSKFQERMVLGDLHGDLPKQLRRHTGGLDLVVIDLVDERGGVIDFEVGYGTKLSEFWSAGGREASRNSRQIPFGSDEHFELWKLGAERVIGELIDLELLHRTVILNAPWAERDDDGDTIDIPDWMIHPQKANQLYARYFAYLEEAGLLIVSLPSELATSSKSHRWGTSPFHYSDSAYEYFASELLSIANERKRLPRYPAVESRRNTAAWGDFTSLPSPSSFLEVEETSGNFSIEHGGLPLDFQVEDNGAATTLVSLHAALGKEMTPPIFTGRAVSDGIGVNRIFISDPGLLASDSLNLAWYLGAHSLNLTKVLTQLLEAIQQRLQAAHLVFFGMSGGGFASLNLSLCFPGSLAIPVNPQTRILSYAPEHWEAMAKACYGATTIQGAETVLVANNRADQRLLYGNTRFENSVIYVQNRHDPHVSSHLIPWFDAIAWNGSASILFGDWGKGHFPPKAPGLQAMLRNIAPAAGDWEALSNRLGANTSPTREWVKDQTGR